MVKTEDYTRELATIFFSQKKTIVYTTLLLALWAILIAFFWPPTFAAEGTVLVKAKERVKSPESLEVEQSVGSLISTVRKEDLASEMNIIVSYDVLKNALIKLKSQNLLQEDIHLDEDAGLQAALDGLKAGLEVSQAPAANIIEVKYSHRDPQYAVTVLKTLLDEYLRYRFELYNPSDIEAFYKLQAEKFSDSITGIEQRLGALLERAGTPRPDLEIENNLLNKKQLDQQIIDLRNRWVEKKIHVDNLQKTLESDDLQLFSYLEVLSINSLAEKVQALVVEKATLLSLYKPDSKKAKNTERQLAASFKALKDEVAAYAHNEATILKTLESQIALLEAKLQGIVKNNLSLSSHQIKLERLKRELALQQQSYEIFIKRWEEAKINSSSEGNNLYAVNVLSRPTVSGSPVFPKKGTLIPVGILAGFITGCCLGFVREYFDHSFKKPEDVTTYANLPTIISIPDWESTTN